MTPGFMNVPAYTLHWHIGMWGVDLYITLANLIVIALMIVVFALAVLLPFPGRRRHR
jgi:hypothetical protein